MERRVIADFKGKNVIFWDYSARGPPQHMCSARGQPQHMCSAGHLLERADRLNIITSPAAALSAMSTGPYKNATLFKDNHLSQLPHMCCGRSLALHMYFG